MHESYYVQPDTSEQLVEHEHQELCIQAAHAISGYAERGGLSNVNAELEKRGYKLIRLSDVLPVK